MMRWKRWIALALALALTLLSARCGAELKLGSHGAEVSSLQFRLRRMGYRSVRVTGRFDKKTQEAVRALQRSRGLQESGVVADAELAQVYGEVFTRPIDPEGLTVTFLDVGLGDAALVVCDGRAMLIDGGPADQSTFLYTYLKRKGITHLDYLVSTHAHDDHVGGLPGALRMADAGTVLAPMVKYTSKLAKKFLRFVRKRHAKVTVPKLGDTFALGGATVQVLGPFGPSSNLNDTCIVLRLVYGSTSFLFAADADTQEEADMVASGFTLRSDVLKVGHHGCELSSTQPFLEAVRPRYGVISAGLNNALGLPREEALSRLAAAHVQLYRTDLQGTIVCVSDGSTLTFLTG